VVGVVPRTGDKQLLRDLNRTIVLNLIAQRGPLSRTDLARQGNLPAASITRIVGEFLAAGLVREDEPAESSGGRPPILLRINPGAGYVAGVKLREDGLTVVVCDLACNVIAHHDAALPIGALPYTAVDAIAAAVQHCIEAAQVARAPVLGCGIGLSGMIDSTRGLCRYSAILGWHNVELGPALEYKLRMPVRVDNDVNTLAVAERQFGVGRRVSDFLLVTLGRGIGLGIVVAGEIYRGSQGGAGEFGHTTVDTSAEAPLCNCGKRGCLEAIASDYGIVRAATGGDPNHQVESVMPRLVARAQAGDSAVRAIFARAGQVVGVAIANLVNIFDPALVVLGGEGLRAGEWLLGPLRETVPRHLFGRTSADLEITAHTDDEVSWARGAASLVLREVFRPPIYESSETPVMETLLRRGQHQRRGRG
jgi:predicted NBD/HSP70 family sugar kinase